MGFDQYKIEENDISYKGISHIKRGQEHSIAQSNLFVQDTIDDNLISSDYRPTSQIIYDQGIVYECLRWKFNRFCLFSELPGSLDLSEIAANLQAILDKKPQVKNYGYPFGGDYYKVINSEQYDTQQW